MKVIKKIEVQPEGELTVFEQTVGIIDGERVTGEVTGRTVWPGDDTAAETAVVRAIATAAHTPECIALYQARRAVAATSDSSAAQADLDAAKTAYESARTAKSKPKR